MKIGIDIDGVLADFVGTFLPKLNAICSCNFDDIIHYNFKNNISSSHNEYDKLWDDQVIQGKIYKELKAIDNSSKALNHLSDDNEIIIISSRQEAFRNETLQWLKKHDINFSKLELVGNLTTKVEKMSKCDIVIEDDLDVARMVEAKGVSVFLFDYPWNRIGSNIVRVKGWGDILDNLKEIKTA